MSSAIHSRLYNSRYYYTTTTGGFELGARVYAFDLFVFGVAFVYSDDYYYLHMNTYIIVTRFSVNSRAGATQ